MYFMLHHSTGTLMLDAQDRNSVLSWTERQLGEAAGRFALVEISDEIAPDWEDKPGTADSQLGCEAFISVTPDSIQRVEGAESVEFNGNCLGRFCAHSFEIRKSSVH
jgi:hypothetical protein